MQQNVIGVELRAEGFEKSALSGGDIEKQPRKQFKLKAGCFWGNQKNK